MIKYGDYIVYIPCNEIGRVVNIMKEGCSACYSEGCTSAFSSYDHLRKATEQEIKEASENIGFHRFDDFCPRFDPDVCYEDCINKHSIYI